MLVEVFRIEYAIMELYLDTLMGGWISYHII